MPDQTTTQAVELVDEPTQIQTFHHGRKVAAAWPISGDAAGPWWVKRGGGEPYEVDNRDSAAFVVGLEREKWERREASLYLPEHAPRDSYGRIAKAPDGLCCEGCGTDLTGDTFVSTVRYLVGEQITTHYLCQNCECYLDDEGDDDA